MKIDLAVLRTMRRRGFTLVELMVVLAIAAILLSIGVPSFRTLIQNQQMVATVNEFFAAITLTRSEAIQRGARVDLVPVDEGNWQGGWVVVVDENNNQRPDKGEKIIFSHGPVPDGIAIQSAFNDSEPKYIAYNGTGRTRINANSQTPQVGSVSFTMDKQVRRIMINFLGRPRICNPDVEKNTC